MGFFIQKNMKEEILKFFRTDRSYSGAVKLVLRYSPKLGLKKQLNLQEETEYLKGCAFEELRELSGIKENEMRSMLASPKPKPEPAKLASSDPGGRQNGPSSISTRRRPKKTLQPSEKQAKEKKPAKLGKPRSRKK